MDELIKMLGIENPYALDRESYSSNFDWTEARGLNSAFCNGIGVTIKALIQWLFEPCKNVAHYGTNELNIITGEIPVFKKHIDCPKCMAELEKMK